MLPDDEAQTVKAYMVASTQVRRKGGCLWRLFRFGVLSILVGIVAVLLLYAVTSPWAFFMGGDFHPLAYWAGWGRMQSKTAGDYFLYVRIEPWLHRGRNVGGGRGARVTGRAYLCTPRGEDFTLNLTGGMPRSFFIHREGVPIQLGMRNWRARFPIGSQTKPSFGLNGHWETGQIVADDRKSLSAAFFPNGTLRPDKSYPSALETEDIQVTLHEGSYSEWKAACAKAQR